MRISVRFAQDYIVCILLYDYYRNRLKGDEEIFVLTHKMNIGSAFFLVDPIVMTGSVIATCKSKRLYVG